MSARTLCTLSIAALASAFLMPPAFSQSLERSADLDAELRNEYAGARPQDPIKRQGDVQPEGRHLQGATGVPETSRSRSATGKLLDNGPITTRPVVILMDFPDYRYTEFLTKEDRPLYVSDSYEAWHYAEMLFSDDTYKGPDNEDFISMNKYYSDESRGLLSIKGDVFGWYTAQFNAAYYGSDEGDGSEQDNASWLVVEAIDALAREPNVDLTDFDILDRHDFDGDGNTLEPDGMIDTIILIHAGRGEEWWGGGYLGADAIWPFRGRISYYNETHSPHEVVDSYGNVVLAEDFVVVEQDTPLGLVVHEYGHSLELPDLYGYEEPIQNWSTMAGGYTGLVIGSMPTGLGAYCKQRLQESYGGAWQKQTTLHLDDLEYRGVGVALDASTAQDAETDTIRINLPLKEIVMATPHSGQFMYYSGKGNNLRGSMARSFDFGSVMGAISLNFKTTYNIETNWDYASLQVKEAGSTIWTSIPGNITTTEDPNGNNPGHGITGSTNGQWVDAQFDLSAYAGKNVDVRFYYWTDTNVIRQGMYVDDITVEMEGYRLFFDDAEEGSQFTLSGFTIDTGIFVSEHYYLVEWRDHQGVDEGLKYTSYRSEQTPYDVGLIIWYVDRSLDTEWGLDQNAYRHPGQVSVGIVDADQKPVVYRTYSGSMEIPDYSTYQIHDAGFSLMRGEEFVIHWTYGETVDKDISMMHPVFDDGRDYTNPTYPMSGLILPQYGLKIFVTEESRERNSVKLYLMKEAAGESARDDDEIVEEIYTDGDEIIVEVDEELGGSAFIAFISNDGQFDEMGIDLHLVDEETYVGRIDDPSLLDADLWVIHFIIIENKDGGRSAIFNSDVYPGFGTPLRTECDD